MPDPPLDLERAYTGRRVCVTGGAGFIGSHLAEALDKLGAEVSVIDDLSCGSLENLAALGDRVRFVRGSILEPADLAEATAGAEVIFHVAALTSVPASVETPQPYHRINATGTLGVLEAARAAGARRVIYAASSSAYGDRGKAALVESLAPQPASPYAASKCAGELMLSAYAHCYGLSGVSLRYFNIFGPRQRPDSPYAAVIPLFGTALLHGDTPTIYGDGSQSRDFTPVANAVRANLLAGASARSLRGETVNVACGRRCTVSEVLEKMAAILGVEAAPAFAPPRVGDILHSQASIERAADLLGYEPVVHMEEGLKETLEWMREQESGVRSQESGAD